MWYYLRLTLKSDKLYWHTVWHNLSRNQYGFTFGPPGTLSSSKRDLCYYLILSVDQRDWRAET